MFPELHLHSWDPNLPRNRKKLFDIVIHQILRKQQLGWGKTLLLLPLSCLDIYYICIEKCFTFKSTNLPSDPNEVVPRNFKKSLFDLVLLKTPDFVICAFFVCLFIVTLTNTPLCVKRWRPNRDICSFNSTKNIFMLKVKSISEENIHLGYMSETKCSNKTTILTL